MYNTQHLINDKGEIIASYRKTHMFDVVSAFLRLPVTHLTEKTQSSQGMMESKSTIPGDKIEDPSSTPVGNVGMLTCYDMRVRSHDPLFQIPADLYLVCRTRTTTPTERCSSPLLSLSFHTNHRSTALGCLVESKSDRNADLCFGFGANWSTLPTICE